MGDSLRPTADNDDLHSWQYFQCDLTALPHDPQISTLALLGVMPNSASALVDLNFSSAASVAAFHKSRHNDITYGDKTFPSRN